MHQSEESMNCDEEQVPKSEPGVFECSLCGLRAPCNYYGQKPPNARSIVLLEKCYTMNDPFISQKDRFLIIGSHCSLCNKIVCVGQECSLFYTKRFCIPCVKKYIEQFPEEIQSDLRKKKHQQNPQSSS
ncbi:cysteine-rich DPF motif domain-containing protein 1 isoform X1 [Amblyraja radiata]|uniref:cysteine-rich DPF motif domain-containing protein 1 isoform X1 n=2 Tax=Amblyraja radiata TaxID=386614 RepID=UPI001403F45C|nr:cysteine-rich DPF motif domain-containing protein 1 isoform X1 [Amblyraja radiata]